jgi:hypothetical protein
MEDLLELLLRLIVAIVKGMAKRREARARRAEPARGSAARPLPVGHPPPPQPQPRPQPGPRSQPAPRSRPLAAQRARPQPPPAPALPAPSPWGLTHEAVRDAILLDAVLTRRR